MKRICVFCGSNPGKNPRFSAVARDLGALLARAKLGLVYGGASVGLMGAVADAVLENGGEVIGVIPDDLVKKELAHKGLQDLRIVRSMHERKALMEKLSDGFVALPGGYGTLDEFCEILSWAQLGYHAKPCGILNVDGYYDKFLEFLDHAVSQGLLLQNHRALILESDRPEGLTAQFERFRSKPARQWIHRV